MLYLYEYELFFTDSAMMPSKKYSWSFGMSQYMEPFSVEASAGDKMASYMSFIVCLCLRLVSPSRFTVSTYAIPEGSDDFKRIMSAGNLSFLFTLITWPTLRFSHLSSRKPCVLGSILYTFYSFSMLSSNLLFMSSTRSLIIETSTTGTRPVRVVG